MVESRRFVDRTLTSACLRCAIPCWTWWVATAAWTASTSKARYSCARLTSCPSHIWDGRLSCPGPR